LYSVDAADYVAGIYIAKNLTAETVSVKIIAVVSATHANSSTAAS
jgi:hypothetical protein